MLERNAERYAAVWTLRDEEVLDAQMFAGLASKKYVQSWRKLKQEGYVPQTMTLFEHERQLLNSQVYWKPTHAFETGVWAVNYDRGSYERELSPSYFQIDVRLHHRELTRAPSYWQEIYTTQLQEAEKTLAQSPDDQKAQYSRAQAYLKLGLDDKAEDQCKALIDKYGQQFVPPFGVRAVARARLGKAKEAREDINVVLAQIPHDPLLSNGIRGAEAAAYLGEEADFLKKLESMLPKEPGNGVALFYLACAYARASDVTSRGNAERVRQSKQYADRAVALLNQAVDAGFSMIGSMKDNPDLRSLDDYQPFNDFLRKHRLDLEYSAVWRNSATQESAESHGLDPSAHLRRCQELVRARYRPATIAVVEMSPDQPLVTASVWHRPVVAAKDRVELARRRANAAIGLMLLGEEEHVWELLRQQTEQPDVRTYLIDRLGPLGADPRKLISRLRTENDVSVRRALLLSLGEFRDSQLREVPADEHNRLISMMQDWYRNDPDPGIHAALGWLSRPGETERIRPKLDWGLRTALAAVDREPPSKTLASRLAAGSSPLTAPGPPSPSGPPSGPEGERCWYINGQGQTFAVFRNPQAFMMGSPGFEPGRSVGEKAHRRHIRRNFALSTEPVTVEQFQHFLKDHPEVKDSTDKSFEPRPDRTGRRSELV